MSGLTACFSSSFSSKPMDCATLTTALPILPAPSSVGQRRLLANSLALFQPIDWRPRPTSFSSKVNLDVNFWRCSDSEQVVGRPPRPSSPRRRDRRDAGANVRPRRSPPGFSQPQQWRFEGVKLQTLFWLGGLFDGAYPALACRRLHCSARFLPPGNGRSQPGGGCRSLHGPTNRARIILGSLCGMTDSRIGGTRHQFPLIEGGCVWRRRARATPHLWYPSSASLGLADYS